jgi:hypothetical protein
MSAHRVNPNPYIRVKPMKAANLLCSALSFAALVLHPALQAQNYVDWTVAAGDFHTASNWSPPMTPGVDEIVVINNAGTATIASDAGDRGLSSVLLGESGSQSGHIIMNGGFFRIGATPADPKVNIGKGTVESSFIMNGGTIFFDGPDEASMAGSRGDAGINELDWEVGEGGIGRFEMHGDSVFRVGDDLKIAESATGHGYCLIDGNAQLSAGSGISVSSGGTNEQILIIGGNAIVDSGNSMGAGSPDGHTDEGYLTLSIGGGRATVTVQDDATFNFQVLSSRQGVTLFTVKDRGQVHIFDVLTGRGFIDDQTPPDRPEHVGVFRSSLSSGPETDSTLILQDQAQMTVNASNGLGISGPRDTANEGGKALMIVRDSASFRIEQYLAIGTGNQASTTDGTLEIRGPDATVSIGGNLNLAVDPDGVVPTVDLTPGNATLHAVLTASTHSTVQVDGSARIAQGILKVTLDGYTPSGGEVYPLIQGGTIDGEFRVVDTEDAPLAEGLSWELEYTADAVVLSVAGGPQTTTLEFSLSGDDITLSWEGGGTLERAETVTGEWSAVVGAASPYTTPATGSAYFRVR